MSERGVMCTKTSHWHDSTTCKCHVRKLESEVKDLRSKLEAAEYRIKGFESDADACKSMRDANVRLRQRAEDAEEKLAVEVDAHALAVKAHLYWLGRGKAAESKPVPPSDEDFNAAMKWAGIGGLMRTKVLTRLAALAPKENP